VVRASRWSEVEMVIYVMDEIVAAADIVAVEAMSITDFLYAEGEATAEFLLKALTWTEAALCRATALIEF
jgi:hypothetical protein